MIAGKEALQKCKKSLKSFGLSLWNGLTKMYSEAKFNVVYFSTWILRVRKNSMVACGYYRLYKNIYSI
jgi:hypothetical protein